MGGRGQGFGGGNWDLAPGSVVGAISLRTTGNAQEGRFGRFCADESLYPKNGTLLLRRIPSGIGDLSSLRRLPSAADSLPTLAVLQSGAGAEEEDVLVASDRSVFEEAFERCDQRARLRGGGPGAGAAISACAGRG